jgi:membrane-anchored protein YejM (alkaline phosphatase superfamily)
MSDAATKQEPAVTRGLLLRWASWFGVTNGALLGLVGLRYLLAFGWPDGVLASVYVVLAFIGQFALLGFLPMVLLVGTIVMLLPRRPLVLTTGVLIAALMLSLVVVDTNVFSQYRFHLTGMTVVLFDTSTWVMTGIIFVALLAFQALLAGVVWQQVTARRNRRGGWLAAALIVVWLGGQGIHIWADATAYVQVTSFTRYLPAYFPMKAKRRLAKLGWVDPAEVEQQRLLRRADVPGGGQLQYPLNPLVCKAPEQTYNILFVLIDALRPDKLGPDTTPTIDTLAREGFLFENHYSGGNSSRMGIFSLFYGLPSTYWQAFYDNQLQPVLMQQLLARDYEIAAFSSVGFGSPAQIDRTVFAAVDPAARMSSEATAELDRNEGITRDWRSWFAERAEPQRPFLSFLYYDPGNAKDRGSTGGVSASELEAKLAGYMRGLERIDADVATVLDDLAAGSSADNTIIIVTGDHGYEFDELGLGYVGHASNYGPYQLKSPLIIRWPGRSAQRFTHRSAHQDLPATLLQEVLGCSNPADDYSSGKNLFAAESWDWFMAGSYNSHAIVEPDKIIVTNPGGFIEVLGPDYRPDSELELDAGIMEEAVIEMRRFYK